MRRECNEMSIKSCQRNSSSCEHIVTELVIMVNVLLKKTFGDVCASGESVTTIKGITNAIVCISKTS